METRKRFIAAVFLMLSITTLILLFWSGWTQSGQRDLGFKTYEISYVWQDRIVELRVINPTTGLEETDVRKVAVIRQEGERIIPQMLTNLKLRRARGKFSVRIIGVEEPYIVELVEWREPIDPEFTPLMKAAEAGDYQTVDILLGKGVEIELRDQRGRTALMLAAQSCNVRIIRALLARGANPNAKGPRGWTALFVAAVNAKTECVKAFVEAGSDVNTRDEDGRTPLSYAQERKYFAIVSILQRAGAHR